MTAEWGLPTEFAEEVLDLVEQIPPGLAVAYGDLADLVGRGGPRAVGTVMSRFGSGVPWWRVIRADGRPPQGLEDEAIQRYHSEGTPMVGGRLAGRRVDLSQARWPGAAAR